MPAISYSDHNLLPGTLCFVCNRRVLEPRFRDKRSRRDIHIDCLATWYKSHHPVELQYRRVGPVKQRWEDAYNERRCRYVRGRRYYMHLACPKCGTAGMVETAITRRTRYLDMGTTLPQSHVASTREGQRDVPTTNRD